MKKLHQSYQVVPQSYQDKVSLSDLGDCKKALNNGSKSFLAASHLLPAQTRDAATALYAFCREADDIVDNAAMSGQGCAINRQSEALGHYRPIQTNAPRHSVMVVGQRIHDIYMGLPQANAADRALASVARHYVIPKTLLDAMLEGFVWDVKGRHYETFDDLVDYAARVAGTVGAMMVLLMGVREPAVVARACDLGVAMQLTNICRDVGEDARAGRCYLPRRWMEEHGIDTHQWLQNPQCEQGIQRIVQRLLREADLLYKRADAGIAALPRGYQRGIRAARLLYAAIGDEVVLLDHNSIDSRAYVGKQRKIKLLAKTLYPVRTDNQLLNLPALNGTQFLVDAVIDATPKIDIETDHGLVENKSGTREELGAVIDLLGRLESNRRTMVSAGRMPMRSIRS